MYAQNNEDDILARYFSSVDGGTFLEIGAFHPKNLSNTKVFVDKGWGGVMVDMSPYSLVDLVDAYKTNDKILIVGAAVTVHKTPPLKSWLVPKDDRTDGALTTTEDWHKDKWKGYLNHLDRKHVPYVTSTISLDELYGFLPQKLHLVSIDVEGTSFDLAMNFDFDRFAVDAIVVEHDGKYQEVYDRLCDRYDAVELNAENIVLVKKTEGGQP
jgi:hypothetical protein